MRRRLNILKQEVNMETEGILVRALLRLCCENELMDEIVKIFKDCNIKYEIIEYEN